MRLKWAFVILCLAICFPWEAIKAQSTRELPIHLFAYDKNRPMAYQDSLLDTQQGVQIYKIAFASPLGSRVNGLLFVPLGQAPFAGILLQHGAPGSAMAQTPRGVYLARHGAVVLAINAPLAERNGNPIQFTPTDSVEQVTYIIHLQRAVDLLCSRPDVDANRIGYVGRSYSGSLGVLLAGIERRIKTYIFSVADGGLVAHFSSTTSMAGDQLPIEGPLRQRWLRAMSPIEPIRFIHRATSATLLFQSARQDEAISVADAEALHRAAPTGTVVKWYNTGHRLNAESYVDQLNWFHDQISTQVPVAEDQKGPNFPTSISSKKP